jgi:glycosyltransferase involved in cell wall biosynthesis
MNIIHINSYFVSNTLHFELVKGLASRYGEINQWVYVPLKKEEKATEFPAVDRVKLWITPIYTNIQRKLWPLKMWTLYADFLKKIKNLKIDITHAHSLISNGLLSYWLYKKQGIPYIVTVRNTDINTFMKNSSFFRWLGYKILKNAKTIIVLSPAYKEDQLRKVLTKERFSSIENKIKIVPNGVDDFWIKNKHLPDKTADELQILFVGKLRENKNILGLISACKILQDKKVNHKLHIIGDGMLMGKVKNASASINCRMYGFVGEKEKLLEIYRQCDVLVVPSFRESFGLIYVEALTQGLPVVYTKGQGFDGNFEDGHIGYSIQPESPESIAEAILKINNDIKRMSANAYEAAERFSWENNSKTLNDIYKQAVST